MKIYEYFIIYIMIVLEYIIKNNNFFYNIF